MTAGRRMVAPRIVRGSKAAERWLEERCYLTELANDMADPDLSIAMARVEPGITTAWHALRGVTERYVVLEGSGRVEIGELEPMDVGPGDVVYVPADTRQRISNTGVVDLRFYALCTPRFVVECYQGLE